MNVCTVCKINLRPSTVGQYFILGNSLSGAIKFTKNTTDVDKYNYSGDGIWFDTHGSFSLLKGSGFGKIIIFGKNI